MAEGLEHKGSEETREWVEEASRQRPRAPSTRPVPLWGQLVPAMWWGRSSRERVAGGRRAAKASRPTSEDRERGPFSARLLATDPGSEGTAREEGAGGKMRFASGCGSQGLGGQGGDPRAWGGAEGEREPSSSH